MAPPAAQGYPRLISRGPIEAVPPSPTATPKLAYLRLISRGPIEARLIDGVQTTRYLVSAAHQPRPHRSWSFAHRYCDAKQYPRLISRGPIEALQPQLIGVLRGIVSAAHQPRPHSREGYCERVGRPVAQVSAA